MPRGFSGQFTGTHLASEAIRCASRKRNLRDIAAQPDLIRDQGLKPDGER